MTVTKLLLLQLLLQLLPQLVAAQPEQQVERHQLRSWRTA
jgi:hypothetical protein